MRQFCLHLDHVKYTVLCSKILPSQVKLVKLALGKEMLLEYWLN